MPYPGLDGHHLRKESSPSVTAKSGETLQSTIGNTTISASEEATIRAEVREVMLQQFAEGRAALRASLGLHNNDISEQSDTANQMDSVINLASSSTIPPQKSEAVVALGSRFSVASSHSHAGNGTSAPEFSWLSGGSIAQSPPQTFATAA